MRPADRPRRALLRWHAVALTLLLALPILVSSVLGLVWLHERGWLVWFALASFGLFAALRVGVMLARWRQGRADPDEPRDLPGPVPDPDWSDGECAAFERARGRIDARLSAPIPWTDLPAEALGVVEEVAADMSGGRRSALDFTVPEALLLIDRVALQYRAFLLRQVPLSDRLSVRMMHWLWRKQDLALSAWESGFLAWRGVRLVLNPAAGLLREAERVLASGLQARLTDRFRRDAQAILLEQAAQAAIDLYSGRLRASEAELARISARASGGDPVDPPLAALRIVLVGQRGAGKSTLVNALLRAEVAETDAAPVTERVSGHDIDLAGVACRLIDTPGLDGAAKTLAALVTQMVAADLVIWVHRANRPGRAADTALAQAFAAFGIRNPMRRAPKILHVATAVDRLLPGWPRPENHLTPEDHALLAQVTRSIEATLGVPSVLALRAEAPDWNIDALRRAIADALPESRRVQRARARLAAGKVSGLKGNLARAGRGLGALGRAALGQLRR